MSSKSSNKVYAIVDCNNFYASCERVFNPSISNRPVVILSNNDGVIIAASEEAKALGLKMQPYHNVKDIIKRNNVAVFSSNYTLYGDMSQRVMATLEQFSPDVEIYSIDEAFLELEGISRDFISYGTMMRKIVTKWTGIPVSIGIAKTKTLAKIANRFTKKNKQSNGVISLIDNPDFEKIMAATPVEDIWGVGRQYSKLLYGYGIKSALDFANCNKDWVRKKMTVVGLRTYLELNGISCIFMDNAPKPKKAIISSRSFGKITSSKQEVKEAVSYFTARAAEKMRKQKSAACLMSVFLRTNNFRPNLPQYHNGCQIELPMPTYDTGELISYALKAFEQVFREGYMYHKVGIMLTDFRSYDHSQGNIFDTESRVKRKRAIDLVDLINSKHGTNTIYFGSMGTSRKWSMKRGLLSRRFTTNINELIEAKV